MEDFGSYESLTWANTHLNPEEFVEARKYFPGQVPPEGEYVDACTGELVISPGEPVPSGTIYLSVESLREHGSYTL